MIIAGILSSIVGLILVLFAGLILLPKIFITDEELKLLAELPIEQSTSHMTGAISGKNLPVAVTDVEKLIEYRKRYMDARKEEREKGRKGLYFLVAGSAFQALGVLTSLGA